ncbi:unnamed protein product [Cunninghamella blakesleeana]
MENQEVTVQELLARIEQNERVRDTARNMRRLLIDRNALSQCDTEIRRAQMYIDYFTEEVRRLQNRSNQEESQNNNNHPENRKKYSTLDLLTTNAPYNKPKVSLKLHELEYKLDVEKKVLDGIKTMGGALDRLGVQGDSKQRDEVKSQMYESIEKLGLLNQSLRKYKNLYIDEGDDEDYDVETPPSARLPPGFRRPVTGKLQLEILEARELTHAPTRMIKSPETTVYIKIDGNVVYKTKPSRNDKWNELCEIHVNKASEVEVAIYDHDAEHRLPIGMFWLKITDIAEGLRKRKLQQDNNTQGWATAGDALQQHQQGQDQQDPSGSSDDPLSASHLPPLTQVLTTEDGNGYGIQAWFDIEPVGELSLRLNFVREAGNRRPLDKLGRAGAVRQRPETVHEMNGHQFVEKKFYNVMKCALCGDFLVNSGYQCDDCEYTCHKKCYTKVVIKCISKSDKDADEDKLNHRIPHRFEPITNIGANWCCHCGYILPLGSKSTKKCSECGITCHIKCAHLVPDFCGLSMEMANQMLAEIKAAKRRTGDGSSSTLNPPPALIKPSTSSKTDDARVDDISKQISQIQVTASTSTSSTGSSSGKNANNTYAPIPNPSRLSGTPLPVKTPTPISTPISTSTTMIESEEVTSSTVVTSNTATTTTTTSTISNVTITKRKITLDDFSFLTVLGKGNFGKVMLAEDRHDQKLYAVKVLKKRYIIDNDEIDSLRSEKRIFQAANSGHHPFLIGLHSCFQTESRVYFVMEYVNGGDLMWHIQREPFSERRAKFYACEVLLALEHFHSIGIIYRDLKLDNIMLSLDGHIKVADYGLCKENMFFGNTTGTFCGTPEFMAPEILLEQRYGRAVDWWAFGVLIYEMLLGQSPFRGEDEDEIFDAILEDDILYPINMSRDSVSICQRVKNDYVTKKNSNSILKSLFLCFFLTLVINS